LPLLIALVGQVSAANGIVDLGIRHSVREGVNGVCEVNACAVAGVRWICAKAVNASQYARRAPPRYSCPAAFALSAITVDLLLNLGDESACFWVG
jgi:hypothetical protein